MSNRQLSKSDQVTKWIAVKYLNVVWATAQKPFDIREADRIAKEFDPDAFGVIVVTLPDGQGIYHVVDGQTRTAAIRSLWGPNEQVPCLVINATTPKEAADKFMKYNTLRRGPSVIARFNVSVQAGYEVEVGVDKLLKDLGYRVVKADGEGIIRAVGTCVAVYKSMGPAILRDALLLIQGTWGKDQASVDASIIRGYAIFLSAYGYQKIDKQHLVDAVKKKHTPGNIMHEARDIRQVYGGTLADNIVRNLVEIYNRRLRSGRIEVISE